MEIIVRHPDEIADHIPAILSFAEGRKLWLFSGEIGAGKTTTIQRICQFLKVKGEVISPSYSLVNEYEGEETIYHIDLYRLADIEEALNIGIEEYLFSSHYCFIEWPEIILPLIEKEAVLNIEIQKMGEFQRKILFLKNALN